MSVKQITTSTPAIEGAPTFNSFDTTTNTRRGPGMMASGHSNSTFSLPLGDIIGGAVGGLLLIALSVFLIVRLRRSEHTMIVETKQEQDHDHSDGQRRFPLYQVQLQQQQQNQAVYYSQPDQGSIYNQPIIFQEQPVYQSQPYYSHQTNEQHIDSPAILVSVSPPVIPNASFTYERYS
ncbi:hypothetical protein K457DRAFT_122829 [Linnemannia elongata AG-77]|uniref:Uncharacterized protein n=1 Tax=Linnemannia elongata AG-77 TaxID=1314771 RepID=A0A197K9P3_9FUNG|nr:hypothetical protein K457DRAFT_122829 [Linnemannia elongata AG-77]